MKRNLYLAYAVGGNTSPSLFVFPASLLNVEGVDAVLLALVQECMACLFSSCRNIAAGSLVGCAHSKDLAALQILDGSLDRDDGHRAEHSFGIELSINVYCFAHGWFLPACAVVTNAFTTDI